MSVAYHLMLGARDWRPALRDAGTALAWDADRAEITLQPDLPEHHGIGAVTLADRRGASADRFGHLYWISNDRRRIFFCPAGSRDRGLFWDGADLLGPPRGMKGAFGPADPRAQDAPELWAMAATRRGYLVVGTRAPAGLLVFDLHGGGPPAWRPWPEAIPFAPFDIAADPCGGAWILDTPDADAPRLWYLDRDLRIAAPPEQPSTVLTPASPDSFHPVGGAPRSTPETTHPAPIPLSLAGPLAALTPAGIEGLPDGTLLLLDQGPTGEDALVHRLICGTAEAAPIDLLERLSAAFAAAPRSAALDLAFEAAPESGIACRPTLGKLYVAMSSGNRAFAFDLEATAESFDLFARSDFLPLRRFGGKALVAAPEQIVYDSGETWLPLLCLARPRYLREGVLDALSFDGRAPGTVWHRLFLDAHIPSGDRVVVETRASDTVTELAGIPWRREGRLYKRRLNRRTASDQSVIDESERPFHRPFDAAALSRDQTGTWELLFQEAIGRHIQIRLRLLGSGRSTPRIRALRASFPRPSYSERFLPAAYREDPVSAAFLERFLANFEGIYTELSDRIGAVERLFDSRTAPSEALDWLARWVGARLDDDWDDTRRRLFLAHAFQLYRSRGTVRGLIWAIRLATDPCPDARIFSARPGGDPFGPRIAERFAGAALPEAQTVTTGSQPGWITQGTPWTPTQGAKRLDQLWRDFLAQRHAPGGNEAALLPALARLWQSVPLTLSALRFHTQTPGDPAHAADRAQFIRRAFPRGYADIGPDDAGGWRDYLTRKHGAIATLNMAYGLTDGGAHTSFGQVPLPPPDQLPRDGPPLADWIGFATVDLPASRRAHRFTVLVPVQPEDRPQARQDRLARIAAVVERERPSHTQFDVQPYWALFRTGSARIGLDTVVGEGARLTAMVLGASYIGSGFVTRGHPYTVQDRWVSGRDGPGQALG